MSMTTTQAQTVLRLVDLIGNAGPHDEQQLLTTDDSDQTKDPTP